MLMESGHTIPLVRKITHQRSDNTRVSWQYDEGTQTGDNAAVGTLGSRASL